MPMTEMEQEALEHLCERLEKAKRARANQKKPPLWTRRDQWAVGLLVARAKRNNGLREEETPADFIARRIDEAFRDLARETSARQVPMDLFYKGIALVDKWWELVREEDDQ